MLSTVTAVTALIFSFVSLLYAYAAVQELKKRNAKNIALKEIAILSGEVTDLKDAYSSLLEQHKRLRSRIGMREKRSKSKSNGSDMPDPQTDPAGWKRYMRLQIHNQKR